MNPFPTVDQIDAVLLDAGETLIFMQPTFEDAFVLVANELGHAVSLDDLTPGLDEVKHLLQERARTRKDLRCDQDEETRMWRGFNRIIFGKAGLSESAVEELADAMQSRFNEGTLNHPAEDTHESLRKLRDAGLKLVVVSNAVCEMAHVLDVCGITPLIDHTIISCAVGWEKPAPEIFQHALEAVDVKPERAIHIGDSLNADIGGAERAGLAGSVLFLNGNKSPDGFRGPSIHRLSELLGLLNIE